MYMYMCTCKYSMCICTCLTNASLQSDCSLLRAFPIAEALSLGADVVVTGRCVDSALTLGPLIHQVTRTHCFTQ